METNKSKVVRRTGKTSLHQVLELFSRLQDTIAELKEAEVTVRQIIKDGQVKVFFNIDDLKLEVAVKQDEL